jgi:hypothetical protein
MPGQSGQPLLLRSYEHQIGAILASVFTQMRLRVSPGKTATTGENRTDIEPFGLSVLAE